MSPGATLETAYTSIIITLYIAWSKGYQFNVNSLYCWKHMPHVTMCTLTEKNVIISRINRTAANYCQVCPLVSCAGRHQWRGCWLSGAHSAFGEVQSWCSDRAFCIEDVPFGPSKTGGMHYCEKRQECLSFLPLWPASNECLGTKILFQ
jgi:hypothetical protein